MKKNKQTRFYLSAQLRGEKFTQDQREFDFVISTDEIDSYGTIFTKDGWDFSRYAENPVVFYQHRSDSDNPDNLIGTTVKGPWEETLENGTNAWVARVRFEKKDVNRKAEKIRKKIIAGTLRMASIAADVLDYHWGNKKNNEDEDTVYFTRKQLFEWSIVNLGSNPGAQLRNKKMMTALRSEKDGSKKPLKKDKKRGEKASKKGSKKPTKKQRTKIGLNIQAAQIELAGYKYK